MRPILNFCILLWISLSLFSCQQHSGTPGNQSSPSREVPGEGRLIRTPLVKGVFAEPTEMTILPNLDILVAQHRGEVLLYKHDSREVRRAGLLDVYCLTNKSPHTNVEEGLLGLQADPDFKSNHYIYVFYSPIDTSVNRLSRFTFIHDTIDKASEKIVLQFYSDREDCCHTGGSIAFGKDHLLFLSAGDNTNPFDERKTPYPSRGFGPMDDRPGHDHYDARRSSANTNDLRGKIMRIRIRPDGSYEIPEGNLFPGKEPKTRPEIYVMGNRNPYRITVDSTTGWLYWGEVGPGASDDSLDTRGPRGYDEINQARKAGFYGWPLFVGNNYPYHLHDYSTGRNKAAFDPARPLNESRNNTGLRELPPVQPAFIWYPYAESPDFPLIGSGGRCAMAGPVYHAALYPEETRMPDYYDGKLFIYDWVRGWFKVVTMRPNGDYDKMEPFMERTAFNAPCDAEMGPDGKLYVLEYGHGWYTKNADAGLYRIDYNKGNRPPVIDSFFIDKPSGSLPLHVVATVKAKDPENSSLSYTWDLGDGTRIQGSAVIEHVYPKPGEYAITVTVMDQDKASIQSDTLRVVAGNEAPRVNIAIKGNREFYFPGHPVTYSVDISDKDDTGKGFDPHDLMVTADYQERGDDEPVPDPTVNKLIMGKNLMLSNDCKTCHKINEKSVGPAYDLVAKRYSTDPHALAYLSQKVRKGGNGVWGETYMPAHPAIKDEDLNLILEWVLSLSGNKNSSLPATGSLDPTLHKPLKEQGNLIISASYTDKGGPGVRALTAGSNIVLRNNLVYFDHLTRLKGFAKVSMTGNGYLSVPPDFGWCSMPNTDLSSIRKVSIAAQWQHGPIAGYTFELHLDAPDGKIIGGYHFNGEPAVILSTGKTMGRPYQQIFTIKLEEVKDGQRHSLYIVSKPDGPQPKQQGVPGLWWIRFDMP